MPSSLVMEKDPFTELTTNAHSSILVELPTFKQDSLETSSHEIFKRSYHYSIVYKEGHRDLESRSITTRQQRSGPEEGYLSTKVCK
ncbi:hypothetical protein DPMN_137885 [Dreissena polymorpha]|uniref:Uncharacterized protein n=1 Tax=Dreissena polymorpha TaxID=45954 RepID=A0A9D4JJ94_DREPO|nr:hypothetical protein DPMN_137885 [Dreissena polymorpha]